MALIQYFQNGYSSYSSEMTSMAAAIYFELDQRHICKSLLITNEKNGIKIVIKSLNFAFCRRFLYCGLGTLLKRQSVMANALTGFLRSVLQALNRQDLGNKVKRELFHRRNSPESFRMCDFKMLITNISKISEKSHVWQFVQETHAKQGCRCTRLHLHAWSQSAPA